MANAQHKVLLVEDTVALATAFAIQLENEGISVDTCYLAAEALEQLSNNDYALVLLDLQLPDRDGLELLREIRERGIETTVIVVTSDASTDRAVDAMRMGARDYLVKPLTPDRLLVTVRNALELVSLKALVNADSSRTHFEGFIGSSNPMQAIYRAIDNIAQSKATVFITGESGTGKELCANAIHCRSPRASGPFIAINCGAIPKDLIETELFGHIKGAFTGAVSTRDGAATLAQGGTLFLDEICEMDIALQTKLLRFLQTSSLQRVGSQTVETVDVRVICATNRNPLVEVTEGRFREDLYYRLNVIPILLPPLRERAEDALLIASEMLKRIAKEESRQFEGFSASAAQAIRDYPWPGNVRELENIIRRVVVMHNGRQVESAMLPEPIYSGGATLPTRIGEAPSARDTHADSAVEQDKSEALTDSWVPEGTSLAELEREIIEATIRRCNNNVTEAASVLGVSPSTLYRKRSSWVPRERQTETGATAD